MPLERSPTASGDGLQGRHADRHEAPEQRHEAAPVRRTRRDLVLIVDPDPDVLQSTALLVEALGYTASGHNAAGDILDIIEREQPGLVLLEVKAPELNVSGLMAALRSDPALAQLPVAFFSASFELPALASRHQAWGHLPKPFGYQELARLLERALGPAPRRAAVGLAEDVEKEVRTAFREYRNVLASLNNYVLILSRTEELSPQARQTVTRLEDLILMLEARTDRLRAYILSLLGPVENVRPIGAPPAPPERVRRQPAQGNRSAATRPRRPTRFERS